VLGHPVRERALLAKWAKPAALLQAISELLRELIENL
jgi:hypothetical protein